MRNSDEIAGAQTYPVPLTAVLIRWSYRTSSD